MTPRAYITRMALLLLLCVACGVALAVLHRHGGVAYWVVWTIAMAAAGTGAALCLEALRLCRNQSWKETTRDR